MKPFTILVDFINLYGAVPQEEVVGSGQNGAQLVWKTGPRKPKLSSVTLPTMVSGQFSNHVQSHGKLNGEAVTDYLSYTTRIYLMLQRYDTIRLCSCMTGNIVACRPGMVSAGVRKLDTCSRYGCVKASSSQHVRQPQSRQLKQPLKSKAQWQQVGARSEKCTIL